MGYICIHGHFYQPPRENPWLEAVELQESAHPYHDWNERINAECYAPNAASRILDEQKRIVRIVNNYSKISFNFGPTLLSWMQEGAPGTYGAVLEADAESKKTYGGHGSALAQAYNHMIMPLANDRDKYTQAAWGIRDFTHRFGRQPEGMWLPETAVDLTTLEIIASLGIRFTILAPNQASRVRKFGERKWTNVGDSRVDPTMVSLVRLPSGKSLNVFFYDGPVSRAIAFERLLNDGEGFAKRLLGVLPPDTDCPRLVNIATDGETYGHHHRFGEMALSYALNYIETNRLAELTNYGQYLERCPPQRVAEIFENSSWSCAHGVERWRSDCGCNSGGHSGWNQQWRAPLRAALDWLRDTLAPKFELKAKQFLKDPWLARNEYIDIILDRSPDVRRGYLAKHATRELDEAEQVTVWKLMELQRHAMLMYTSCGWFFDELSGIETVQVIQYAGRAVQLAEEVFEERLEQQFIEKLSAAKSNLPEHGDGGKIYQKWVKASMVDLRKVGAHYAIRSLFEPYETTTRIYAYSVDRLAGATLGDGDKRGPKLAVGEARFTSEVTQESEVLGFAALGVGNYNPTGGTLKCAEPECYQQLVHKLADSFGKKDLETTARILEESLLEKYSLAVLFRDEQRRILNEIIESEWTEAEAAFTNLYPYVITMIRTLVNAGAPDLIPRAFYAAAEFAMNTRLRNAIASEKMDFDAIHSLISDAEAAKVPFDVPTLEFTLRTRIEHMAEKFGAESGDLQRLKDLEAGVALARSLPMEVNLWKIQNLCYDVLQTSFADFQQKSEHGDQDAAEWVSSFRHLAENLSLLVK